MKKTFIGLASILLIAGSVSVASALTLTDTTEFTATGTNAAEDFVSSRDTNSVNFLSTNALQASVGNFDYVTWNHLFTFDPAADLINSASLTLSFRDDSGDSSDRKLFQLEFGFGYTESGNWDLGEVDTGDYTYGLSLLTLADGVFQVTVASVIGDFYLDKSVLTIDYTPAPVPEPSTMILMGLGLAGLVGYNRKRTNKNA